MLDVIHELKKTEKKAAKSIEDAGTKSTEQLAQVELTGKEALEALQTKLDKDKLDELALVQKEVDKEVASIEAAGKKELEALKKTAASKKSKIIEAVQKAILQ